MMTYSALVELAFQREQQIAARARLPRPGSDPPRTTTRRTRKHGRVASRVGG